MNANFTDHLRSVFFVVPEIIKKLYFFLDSILKKCKVYVFEVQMAAITLAMAQERLTMWLEAEAALATGQSYSINVGGSTRSLTRVDAKEVRGMIEYWRGQVERLETGSGAPRVRLVTPRDN